MPHRPVAWLPLLFLLLLSTAAAPASGTSFLPAHVPNSSSGGTCKTTTMGGASSKQPSGYDNLRNPIINKVRMDRLCRF